MRFYLFNFHRKGVVHKLIPGLEKHRNAELAERKEKRKKQHGSEKENEKDSKDDKERLNTTECKYTLYMCTYAETFVNVRIRLSGKYVNISAAPSSLIQIDEQRSSASTSQRTDVTPLVAGEETTVETTRPERTPEEDIIGILIILKRERERNRER